MKFKIFALIIVFYFVGFAQVNDNRFRLAQSYAQAGEYEKARDIYEDLYSKDPDNLQIFDALNNIYIQLKEYNSSIQIIELRLKNFPADINLYGMLGSTYYLMDNEKKAFEIWDEAIKKVPVSETNFRTLSNYAIQRRAFKKAAEYLKRGRDIAKDPKYFSYDIANIYAITMQYKEAAEEYCRVLSANPNQLAFIQSKIFTYVNKPDALQQTVQVVENHLNNNISFYYLLSRLYIENKNYEKALDIYRDIDAKQGNQGTELFNFAQIMFNEEQFDIAAEVYKEIINKNSNSEIISNAKLGYARALEESFNKNNSLTENWKPYFSLKPDKNNDVEKVVAAYLELPKIYPNSEVAYEAYLHIGRIKMYHQDNLNDAQNYFQKITEEAPLSKFAPAAYAELGKVYLLKNDLKNAELNYSKIVESSNTSESNKNYASFQLARINFFQNNFDKAREILNKILNNLEDNSANDAIELSLLLNTSKNDSSNLTEFAAAEFLAEQKKFKEALEKYKIIASDPQALILQNISELREAEMELALGNLDSSLKLFQKIVDEGEKNIYADKALFLSAKIYQFELNDKEKAVKMYENLLAKFPNSLYLDEARDQIIKLRQTS